MRSHSGIPEHHLDYPRNNEVIMQLPLAEQNEDEEEEEEEEEGEDAVENEEEEEEYDDEEPQIQIDLQNDNSRIIDNELANDHTSFLVEEIKQKEQVILSPDNFRDLDNS